MNESHGRTVTVEIFMSQEMVQTLSRYRAQINAMIRRDNEILARTSSLYCDEWSEADTISALFGNALERERRLQTIQDGRADDPPWITQLVRDALMELRAAS